MFGAEIRPDGEAAMPQPGNPRGRWPTAGDNPALVLVAIEHQPVRDLIAALLEGNGYRIVVAASFETLPDLADVALAIVDLCEGVELPTPLRSALHGIPVVATTSLPAELVAGRRGDAEPDVWLRKPFSPVVLLRTVQALLLDKRS